MLANATSPDGNIFARIGGADDVEVTFRPGTLHRYDDADLRHQLERLGALSWVAFDRVRTEEYRRTLGLSAEELAAVERVPVDERRRRYDADLAAVEADGESPGGHLRIHAKGLLHWRLDIEPGVARSLGERRFVAELNAAVRKLFADRAVKITVVKCRHYDLGIPQAWRNLLIDLADRGR
jgi:hypothetical protein